MSLAAICCHFNPQGYARPLANYWRFRKAFRGCPLWTIELSFDGQFQIPFARHVTGRPRNLMWQKERLLNLLAAELPDHVDMIAWVDADVLFLNPDWARETERALEEYPVVQLFRSAHFLDQHGQVCRVRPSFGEFIRKPAGTPNAMVAPGFGWAARREVFPLFDANICGGGDKMLAEGWRGNWQALAPNMTKAWYVALRESLDRPTAMLTGRIGCINGDLIHLWHGRMSDRNYQNRYERLHKHLFDPKADLALDDNGLWHWNSDKPEMHAAVAQYFAERREDG